MLNEVKHPAGEWEAGIAASEISHSIAGSFADAQDDKTTAAGITSAGDYPEYASSPLPWVHGTAGSGHS